MIITPHWNWITIPFRPQFREVMLSGQKILTARTKRFGAAGDRFQVFGATFEVVTVSQECLQDVSEHWLEEGCTSRENFISIWLSLHPRKGYDPEELVWLHRFAKI